MLNLSVLKIVEPFILNLILIDNSVDFAKIYLLTKIEKRKYCDWNKNSKACIYISRQ